VRVDECAEQLVEIRPLLFRQATLREQRAFVRFRGGEEIRRSVERRDASERRIERRAIGARSEQQQQFRAAVGVERHRAAQRKDGIEHVPHRAGELRAQRGGIGERATAAEEAHAVRLERDAARSEQRTAHHRDGIFRRARAAPRHQPL
jgi:hypothetical protein